jgi:imidazolonepropionase-like amidohydrolase
MVRKFIPVLALIFLAPSFAAAQDLALKGGTLLTLAGGTIENGTILVRGGKITAIGTDVSVPAGVPVIDVVGKFVMPGIIDSHVHIALPGMSDVNEMTDPVTPQIWMKDALVPGHDSILKTLAGGVTAVKTMHGSANVIGGVNVTIKLKYNRPVDELIVDTRQQLKMALGENPKRVYGRDKNRAPSTRMGNAHTARKAFVEAREYKATWDKYEQEKAAGKDVTPPERDLGLETLKMVLEKKLSVDCHAYRADEIVWVIEFCREFGIDLLQISHCTDGYKVGDVMAAAGVSYGGWVDSWGFKEEAYDGCPWGIQLMHEAGVNIVVNSDSVTPGVCRYLFLDVGKVMRYTDLPEEEVLKMITLNPAKALEMDHLVGTLEVGKHGDLAVFDKHPLDSTTKCIMTIIEGEIYFDYAKDSLTAEGGSHE